MKKIQKQPASFLLSGQKVYGDAVIVATGGISYPSTGIHRGRIPFRPGKRTSGYGAFAFPRAHGSKGMVCR